MVGVAVALLCSGCASGSDGSVAPEPGAGAGAPADSGGAQTSAGEGDELDAAIVRFRRFVEENPDDLAHTPEALLRLAELLFERSEREAARAGGSERPDLTDSIAVYRDLLQRFPDYRRATVSYLLGYALYEQGRTAEAREAWLGAVCDPMPSELSPETYASCEATATEGELWSEAWLRIGETHFDDPAAGALELAAAAYTRAATDPEARFHPHALYKLAWTLYRLDAYASAATRFGELLTWYEAHAPTESDPGLRAEAVTYLAIVIAHDDWNENATPDPAEGLPGVTARMRTAIPREPSWAAEVAVAVGDALFDEARYPEAIAAWELARDRWNATDVDGKLAQAHRRMAP